MATDIFDHLVIRTSSKSKQKVHINGKYTFEYGKYIYMDDISNCSNHEPSDDNRRKTKSREFPQGSCVGKHFWADKGGAVGGGS